MGPGGLAERAGEPALSLLVAWVLSATIGLAGRLGGPVPEGSLVAAVALPWLALLGLPPRAGAPRRRGRIALALALAAPVLGLAAGLEAQAGAGAGHLAVEFGGALGLIALLALGIERGATSAAGALAGASLLIALPLFTAILGWNDGPGGAPSWLETASKASPLTWAFRRAGPGADPAFLDLLAPLITVLVLAAWPRRSAA